jgi:hypothetical protein
VEPQRRGVSLNKISEHYDELEKQMLDEFYDYIRSHSGHLWIHWNMRNIHYGFQAIAHRYKVLGGTPPEIHESQLVDLSRLLFAVYGPKYIGHPRLQKLVEKNRMSDKDFLPGADEAVAFEGGEYVKLHFSTLRKVDIIATLARRTDDRSLKTDSKWRDIYGLWPQAIAEWLNENWVVRILEIVFAIIGFVATVIQIVQWIP